MASSLQKPDKGGQIKDLKLSTRRGALHCLGEEGGFSPALWYWRLGCKVLNLPGNDVRTYLDGLKAHASRAQARLKSIGVPTP
jgi:hypothetical protein